MNLVQLFQIISVHLSLPLFNFTQWKNKCASYSFTQYVSGSLVVKYTFTGEPKLVSQRQPHP